MKKQEKLNILRTSIGTYQLCRCRFDYDSDYWWQYYMFGVSDRLLFGAIQDDFMLNGFSIRKLSDLKKLKINDDLRSKINEEHQLIANVTAPQIDLSSWQTVFASLKPLDLFVIVENDRTDENENFFYIGRILKVKKSHLLFSHFDADGIWQEDEDIPYFEITSVTFGDRYSKTWQEYLSKHQ